MNTPVATPGPTLYAAVLAAGQSLRFGSTKLLAEFRGHALVAHAIRSAEKVCGERTVLVTGSAWQDVHLACKPLRGFLVVNENYAKGMSTSIAAAVRALPNTADGMLLTLGDQPLVTSEDLHSLAEVWRQNPELIACSRFGAQLSPPTIFPRRLFGELLELQGDRGARSVVEEHADDVRQVEMPHAQFDVDTPQALRDLVDTE